MLNNPKELIDHEKSERYINETISLADIFLVLASNIKIIIIVPSFLCIYTIIYALYFTTPVFTSTSKIMSSSSRSGTSHAAGLAAKFGINLPTGQSTQKWVYPEIIKSRTLVRSVLKRKFNTNNFGPQKSLLQILTYGNGEPQFSQDTLEILAVDKLLEMINVIENINTGIMTLRINAPEPRLAAELNNAFIEELDAHQQKYNKGKTIETRYFIEARIKDTEKELMSAEEDLKVFMDRNRRIENSPALQLEQQRLGREVTVLTGVFTTLKQQLETTKIEEVKESDYVIVVDPPEIPLVRSKPNKRNMVIMAGILGLGLGVFFSLIREFIFRMDEIEKAKYSKGISFVWKSTLEMIPTFKRFSNNSK